MIPDKHPGKGDDEHVRAQGGEYIVKRASAVKYRRLLDAINRDKPAEVKRIAAKLKDRMVA